MSVNEQKYEMTDLEKDEIMKHSVNQEVARLITIWFSVDERCHMYDENIEFFRTFCNKNFHVDIDLRGYVYDQKMDRVSNALEIYHRYKCNVIKDTMKVWLDEYKLNCNF
jgi:hypothetical protein